MYAVVTHPRDTPKKAHRALSRKPRPKSNGPTSETARLLTETLAENQSKVIEMVSHADGVMRSSGGTRVMPRASKPERFLIRASSARRWESGAFSEVGAASGVSLSDAAVAPVANFSISCVASGAVVIDSVWRMQTLLPGCPKTLLAPKLDKARILTYGYDAYIVRKGVASSNRLIDHAANLLNDLTTDRACCNAPSRPIIFVVHSLGGLVCKQAILLSRNNPEAHLRDIFNCIIGIVFMGTPHRGAWMADWADIPASALGLVKSVNKSLLKILQTDNEALELIQVNFWSMIRERQKANQPPEVTCFFEELPLPGVGTVVSKESATLEGYNPITTHANHRDMVRFASAEENGFKRVLGELVRWVSQVGKEN